MTTIANETCERCGNSGATHCCYELHGLFCNACYVLFVQRVAGDPIDCPFKTKIKHGIQARYVFVNDILELDGGEVHDDLAGLRIQVNVIKVEKKGDRVDLTFYDNSGTGFLSEEKVLLVGHHAMARPVV